MSWVRLPGAERCADLRELASEVDSHLQRSAFVAPSQAALQIEASVKPTPAKAWQINVALSDGSGTLLGTRELLVEQPNCAEAVDAAALTIALLIDPEATLYARSPAAPPPEMPARGPVPVPLFEQVRPVASASPRRANANAASPELVHWRARISLGGAVGVGGLPRVASGAYAALRLAPPSRRWGFDLVGVYLPAQTAQLAQEAVRARISSTSAELLGWLAPWQRSSWSLASAVGVEAASLSAAGSGLTTSRSGRSWMLSARLELELSWQFSERWSLLLRPGLGLPVRHDHFDAAVGGKTRTVFEPSPLTGGVTLGVGFEP